MLVAADCRRPTATASAMSCIGRAALFADDLLFALAHVADPAATTPRPRLPGAGQRPGPRTARGRGQTYNADEHTRYVDRLIAAFTPDLFRRLADAGDDDARPVFVFGLPHSGTTLVEQVLASHSQVFGAGELPLVRKAMDALPTVEDPPEDMTACLEVLDANGLKRLTGGYGTACRRCRPAQQAQESRPESWTKCRTIISILA